MSDCTHYRPLVGSRPGELAAAEAGALAAHLATCDGCRAWEAELAAADGLLARGLLAEAARRDFAPFVDRVLERVGRRAPAPLLERLVLAFRRHPALAIGAALAPIAAVVALVLALRLGGDGDLADARAVQLTTEGGATTVIQSKDGPVVLLDDDEES